jgi:hypothetical protein
LLQASGLLFSTHSIHIVCPGVFGPESASGARFACITEEGVARHAIGAVLVKLRPGVTPAFLTLQLLSSLHDLDSAFCTHTTQTTPPSPSIIPVRPITTFLSERPTLHLTCNQPPQFRFQPRLRGLVTRRFYDRRLKHRLRSRRSSRHSSPFLTCVRSRQTHSHHWSFGPPQSPAAIRIAVHAEQRFMHIICKE